MAEKTPEFTQDETVEITPPLTRAERLEILKRIARDNKNAAAAVAAIRKYEEMEGEAPPSGGFADLDGPARMATVSRIRTKR